MIQEHIEIINYINDNILYSLKYIKKSDFKISYINIEYCAIQLEFSNGSKFINSDLNSFFDKLKYLYNIVTDIYTVDYHRLYVIYLMPIEEMRNKKINKIKYKIENGV